MIPIETIPYTPPPRNEIELDDYQKGIVEEIGDRINAGVIVTTLGGLGGTGKSVIVSRLARMFPRFAVVAPTNKAVKVLKAKGIDRAQTVHSLVKVPAEDLPTEEQAQEIARKLSANPPQPLSKQEKLWCMPEFGTKSNDGKIHGIICDEASMIDKALFIDLLTQEVPLIFTGDHGQLPPVAKDPDDPAFSLMKTPDMILSKIYRNAGDIARFAAHMRNGGRAEDFKTEDGSVIIGNASDIGLATDSQLLAWKNDTVLRLNRQFRMGLGMTGAVCEGDRVMFDYNWKAMDGSRIYKGDTGIVEKCLHGLHNFGNPILEIRTDGSDTETGKLVKLLADINFFTKAKVSPQPRYVETPVIDDENDRTIRFDRQENPQFGVPIRHAYALTVHKSQGSEWPNVTVIQDMPYHREDFDKWAYTAASRAKSQLIWLFDR
jgi:exodeoxyribonuclease-5